MNHVNHIAILVSSVDRAAERLSEFGFQIGAKEVWDGEGTAEIYVGGTDHTGKILLMEPIKPGAYARAMETRGPGLHHIAIDVLDLEVFIAELSGSGWYLHPKSSQTIRKTKTAWLARPGTKMLIEVQQRDELLAGPLFVSRLDLPLTEKERSMVKALRVEHIQPSEDGQCWFLVGQHRIEISKILSTTSSQDSHG